MRKIEFKISGQYLNGDAYWDNHYNIFELQELLDNLQSAYEQFHSGKGNLDKSDVVDMESINIAMVNADGDELDFQDYDKKQGN